MANVFKKRKKSIRHHHTNKEIFTKKQYQEQKGKNSKVKQTQITLRVIVTDRHIEG